MPVRAAAAALLARLSDDPPTDLLGDPAIEVRRAAALAIGRKGGAAYLAKQLGQGDSETLIEAIGLVGAAVADDLLFGHLATNVFPAVTRQIAALKALPAERPGWRPLALVLADANAQAIQTVLQSLSALGYKRVLTLVRTAMRTGDERTRANAVETLSTLAHRRYVLPLLPLLDPDDETVSPPYEAQAARRLLTDLKLDPDRFIRAAARLACTQEFGPAADDEPEDLPMNRLVFLKSVPLFSEMSLTDLLAVDQAMTRETYLPGEVIVREGEVGDKLFIVFTGEVAIRKRVSETEQRELARLTPGQLFGEMSLFDDETRSATVAATMETQLLALDREQFHSVAHQRPDIPMQVCKVLVGRLRKAIA